MSKGSPIPVRFEPQEARVIEDLARRTGLTQAEIVRRACRLLYSEVKARGPGLILGLIEGVDAVLLEGEGKVTILQGKGEGEERHLRVAEEPKKPEPKRATPNPQRRRAG
jgi:hypothetical protein